MTSTKQLFIFICLCLSSIVSLAQDSLAQDSLPQDTLPQDYKFTLGIGVGFSQSLADVTNRINFQRVFHADLDYHITEFITAGAAFHSGRISNGSAEVVPNDNPNYSRYFVNDFKAVSINTKIALGHLINLGNSNFLGLIKGTYIGTGMTVIFNNIIDIRRTYTFSDGTTYALSGKDRETILAIPILAGLNFILPFAEEHFSIGLDGQINIVPGDHLDGYSENIYPKGPDWLALGYLSIRYNFINKP